MRERGGGGAIVSVGSMRASWTSVYLRKKEGRKGAGRGIAGRVKQSPCTYMHMPSLAST